MFHAIRRWLQTALIDRDPAEPVYVTVSQDAIDFMEAAIIDLLSDPMAPLSIADHDRLQLVVALSRLTGKPDLWIGSFINSEREKRRGLDAFYAARMEGASREL